MSLLTLSVFNYFLLLSINTVRRKIRQLKKMFNLLGLVFLPLICQAAHFEGGTISYKVLNTSNSTVSIMISQTYIYVYPTIYCNNSYIINQSPPLNMAGRGEYGKYLNCTANCSTSGGYVPVPLDPYCTDYSSAMSITIGERLDVVNILIGSYFVVSFASNNWRPLTLPPGNGGSLAWSLSCTVDLRLRPNGALNHPPVAAIISPIYIPVGIQQAIFIPTIDADNDQVRCRFALNGSNECADVCPPASLPNGTVILSNCTLFITGTNVGDWYAVAIMVRKTIISYVN